MSLLRKIRLWLCALFRKQKLDRDMDEEMRAHLELRTQANIEAGMSPEEARYAALRSFGGMAQVKEGCRDLRGVGWIDTFWRDIRFSLRMLQKNPGFAIVVVLTLALGIGANTAIFSVVSAVLLRPLPYQESDRLITIWERNPQQGYDQNLVATGTFLDWQQQSRSFQDMAIFESNLGLALTSHGEPERITGTRISANLFQVLGVQPVLGRSFTRAEESRGRGQVVMLSHGCSW